MIAALRRSAVRALSLLLARKRFKFDGGSYTVAEGVLNPTLFRASLVFAQQALEVAGPTNIDVMELGSGCGLASVALARRRHRVTAVDRNLKAALNTSANARDNQVTVQIMCSDWGASLAPDLAFDLVVTNPPFLPSPTPILRDALWGGPNLNVVAAALSAAARHLRPDGRVLLLTSVRSGRPEVMKAVQSSGLTVITENVVRHWGEKLHFDILARLPCDSQR